MSIELRHVGKSVRRGGEMHILFNDLNLPIEPGARIAILGLPKSGKTTLLRMICGTDYADVGTIVRESSASWPIPMSDFFVANSTVASNIRFLMRLYGSDNEKTLRDVAAMVDITEFLNWRLISCPRHVKSRLAFGLGVGLGFDVYLFDERVLSVDKDFKPQATEILKSLGEDKAIVVATSQTKEIADLCETSFVLEDGRLTPFSDVKEGIEYYKSLTAKAAEKEPEEAETGSDESDEDGVVEMAAVVEIGI